MQSLMWDSLGEGREFSERQRETESQRERGDRVEVGGQCWDECGVCNQVVMTCS